MVQLRELTDHCDALLQACAFSDYAPNGLQVEGRSEVRRLITGVTASERLLELALASDADAVLVHHGYFWKGEDARVTGMKARRLARLLCADVSLLAYHLPLDAHPELGNNAQLAERLGVTIEARVGAGGVPGLLALGGLEESLPATDLAARLGDVLDRRPTHIGEAGGSIHRIAICTGAGQRFLAQAAACGADALVSGEISEPTAHEARELGIHYFAAGHHATERFGVQALGERLAERFGLTHGYIEVDNPA